MPAVINGAGSVFATDAAREWLRLLEALERPALALRAHAARAARFLGWDAEQVASRHRRASGSALHARLHRWAAGAAARAAWPRWSRRSRREACPARLLGARRAASARSPTCATWASCCTRRRPPSSSGRPRWPRGCGGGSPTAEHETARRGAQPAPGVRRRGGAGADHPPQQGPGVPHRLPARSCGSRRWIPEDDARRLPRPRRRRRATVDVGLEGADVARHASASTSEERGEDLRLAYVALTRARHQAVLWWAGSYDTPRLGARPAAVLPRRGRDRRAVGCGTPAERGRARARGAGAAAAPGASRRGARPAPAPWRALHAPPPELAARRFDRGLDSSWRRTSYSGLTAGAHEAAGRRASRRSRRVERRARTARAAAAARAVRARRRVAAGRPAGRRTRGPARSCTGCWRRIDFAAADLAASCGAVVEALARRPVDIGDAPCAPGWPPRSRRRSARSSAAPAARRRARRPARRAGLRAPAGGRRRRRRGEVDAGRDRRRPARRSRPATRSPATPSGWRTRCCGRACAAT